MAPLVRGGLRSSATALPLVAPALSLLLLLGRPLLAASGSGGAGDAEVAQLKCAVCELAMAEANVLVAELGLDLKNEDDVIDFADSLCTLSKREGRWLRRLDVKDTKDGRLAVQNMTEFGECRMECLLVRKACQSALGKAQELLVDLLRTGADADELRAKVCKASCRKRPPPLKHKRTDEEFVPGHDAGMLQMMENRDKMRAETGQVFDIMKRDELDTMSDGDREAQAAQDAFAEQLREAREDSGRDWRGREMEEL
mmetsp:Transcript_76675/g.194567  ORF Transcript_76675/g.194567 Transcript_76675/m.194567 type:complete len:256 (-) Transcript_76675:80-847(-)